MNKKIKQICQKINIKDIFFKKNERAWFFTNEKNSDFLSKLKGENIKKIYSISGGGDFAFNCLVNFKDISKINLCDVRLLSNITVDLKSALIKKLSVEELKSILKNSKIENNLDIYSRIEKEINPITKLLLCHVFNNCNNNNFINCLKNSKFWYKHSFVQNNKKYLLYLEKENYKKLRKNLYKINIYQGLFDENLDLFENNFYDLIYTSNIFDNKKYCDETEKYLKIIKNKLNKKGFLLLTTQKRPNKIIKKIKKEGFEFYRQKTGKINLIQELFGHCRFSILLFKIE